MYLSEMEEIKYSIDTELLSMAWYMVFVCKLKDVIKEMMNPRFYHTCYENNGLRGFYSKDDFRTEHIKKGEISIIRVWLPENRYGMNRCISKVYMAYTKTVKGISCPQFYYVEGNRLKLMMIDGEKTDCGIFHKEQDERRLLIKNYIDHIKSVNDVVCRLRSRFR